MWRVLLARTSVQSQPSPFHFQGVQAALSPGRQPCSSLERRDGWRPEREADSSANSASLDRPSAVLPIVALPRNHRAGAMRGELFFKNYAVIYTHTVYGNDDYYFQMIIIEVLVAQLRQHKQRLNDLRMQLG